KADQVLSLLQDRNAIADPNQWQNMVLTMQNHIDDPVGRFVGGNPPTGGTTPEGNSSLIEIIRAVTGQKDTSHNCYGVPSSEGGCGAFWKDSPLDHAISIPVNQMQIGNN
ncbi:hypothetical protein, partial [Dyella jejuensis]